ncbi:MAG: methyltransferase [Rhodocyclaceae bacterium]|nr:MAG: methyltransferase [Rhodocyclaceae bacterium]
MSRLLIALTLAWATATTAAEPVQDAALAQWIAGPQRSEANRKRDVYRHPQETLAFFELKDNLTVVEVWPSVNAWWAEILAPYLRDHGRYIMALHAGAHNPAAAKAEHEVILGRIANQPTIYGKGVVAHLPGLGDTVAPNSADRVLTFLNLHNWIVDGEADGDLAAFYTALKPGGILGIVDHRGRSDLSQETQLASGYLREDYVIALAQKAGFKLVATSEISANPRDSKDYPEGVWTLPPSLRLKDVDREKYLSIGESDKFTLKFVKP